MKLRCIVFGGGGFLGKWLVDELVKQQGEVVVCDIVDPPYEHIKYYEIDITQRDAVINFNFYKDDIVIHLAANQYHHKVPRKDRQAFFHEVNVRGTQNILDGMIAHNCGKMIYFSTDMVYGKPIYLPVDTNHAKMPFGPYGQSKKEAEWLCETYRDKGVHISIFRPRMIIGPGRLGILKNLFFLMKYNLPVLLISNGQNHYQMISVFDCVSAVLAAIQNDIPNTEYNLGSKNPPTVYNLLQGLIKEIHSRSKLIKTKGKWVKNTLFFLSTVGIELLYKEQYMIADENYILDISKTEQQLQWSPKFTDDSMIIEAYKYYIDENGR